VPHYTKEKKTAENISFLFSISRLTDKNSGGHRKNVANIHPSQHTFKANNPYSPSQQQVENNQKQKTKPPHNQNMGWGKAYATRPNEERNRAYAST
jgi:hypothetical protein